MKLRFIVNARSGRAARVMPVVREYAAKHDADFVVIDRSGGGSALATQAVHDGCDLVVAVGGDGTMNEVASALIGTPATLGLVPCGSGDGLGRFLGIHGPPSHCFDVLEHGVSQVIDSGLADGHAFFTAAGIGFEAEIAQRFNALTRRGFVRYLTTSAALWRQWEPQVYTIRTATESRQVRAFTLAVGNANQYGNGARIAPEARVDDGLLNLTAVPPVTLLNSLPLLCRLFAGSVTAARQVTSLVGARFTVERSAPGWLHTDGELHQGGRTVEFEVRPASLRIRVPRVRL